MHSHLLPGIDDGAESMETSIKLIEGLQKLGYQKLITTPHVYEDMYPNKPEIILSKLEELRQVMEEKQIPLEIDAAAEYMLDDAFESLVQSGKILTLFQNHVLIEMNFSAPYPKLHEIIFQLQVKGYHPILAHPERYEYYWKNPQILLELKNRKVLFQANLLSLIGYYGRKTEFYVKKLIEQGYVELLGTDIHNIEQLEELSNASNSRSLKKIIKSCEWKNSLLG